MLIEIPNEQEIKDALTAGMFDAYRDCYKDIQVQAIAGGNGHWA